MNKQPGVPCGNYNCKRSPLYKKTGPDCFPAETALYTPAGTRELATLRVGESVLSINSTGEIVFAQIARVIRHAPAAAKMYTVKCEQTGSAFSTTGRHPILTRRGWRRASSLVIGDEVAQFSQAIWGVKYTKVSSIDAQVKIENLYNLHVKEHCNFVVAGGIAHSFVHFRSVRSALHTVSQNGLCLVNRLFATG